METKQRVINKQMFCLVKKWPYNLCMSTQHGQENLGKKAKSLELHSSYKSIVGKKIINANRTHKVL